MNKSKERIKLNAEVFTPEWLIDQMLDQLPQHVWKDENLTWLEPAAGNGNMIVRIAQRRLEAGQSPKAILSTIKAIELMEDNAIIARARLLEALGLSNDPEAIDLVETNIQQGSFLEYNEEAQYDVIVANPPYQIKKPNQRKSTTIWNKFVIKSLEHLSEGGYMTQVHPPGWRNVSGQYSKVKDAFLSRRLLYLQMHDLKDGQKAFGASTPYDFYVLHNLPANGTKTNIKCIDGTNDQRCLEKWSFIPGGMFDQIRALLAEDPEADND